MGFIVAWSSVDCRTVSTDKTSCRRSVVRSAHEKPRRLRAVIRAANAGDDAEVARPQAARTGAVRPVRALDFSLRSLSCAGRF